MVYTLIKKTQKHPPHVREKIAVFTAGFIAFIVFVGWVSTLDSRLVLFGSEAEEQTAGVAQGLTVVNDLNHNAEESDSPANIFSKKIGEAVRGVRNTLGY